MSKQNYWILIVIALIGLIIRSFLGWKYAIFYYCVMFVIAIIYRVYKENKT